MTLWPQFAQPRINAYLKLHKTIIYFFPCTSIIIQQESLKKQEEKNGMLKYLEMKAAVTLYNNELIITLHLFMLACSM